LNRGLRRAMESETSEAIRGTLRRGPRSSRGAHRCFSLNHAEDVALLHDEQILAINLDLGARPLPEQHTITTLHVERNDPSAFIARTRTRSDHFALHRLFLRRVGNDDTAGCLRIFFDSAHDHTIMQRTELHGLYLDVQELLIGTAPAPAIGASLTKQRGISTAAALRSYLKAPIWHCQGESANAVFACGDRPERQEQRPLPSR